MGSAFSQNTQQSDELLKHTINLTTEIKNAIQQLSSPIAVTELYNKLVEVEKENTSLKKLLADEIEKNKILRDTPKGSDDGVKTKQRLDLSKISDIVDKMLQDKNVNIAYLPDVVERQIYINTFTILLGVLENVLETSKIEVLGQTVNFEINEQK